jgi:hypothetical protein
MLTTAVGIRRLVTSMLTVILLASCGGGGSTAPPPPTAPASTVSIGGNVSGLIGTVVLQNNSGANLSLTANGAFKFPTGINKGDAYAVTILKQPSGPTCALANGSGTATDDVTNITVTCTTDPATAYLPLDAFALSGTSGGTNGLLVISTKAPAEAPIPVLNEGVMRVAVARQSNGIPANLFYTTFHTDGSNHIWSLDLSGASTLLPAQISNLTLPRYVHSLGGQLVPIVLCGGFTINKNLNDPNSAFLVLAIPRDETNCQFGHSPNKWVLIHPTDSPSTDPVTLPSFAGTIVPLYQPSGALAGIVAVDGSTNHLNFYADETFTNPTQLLADAGPLDDGIDAGSGYTYLVVQPAGATITSPVGSLYRIDSTGTLSSDLYDFQGSGGILGVTDPDHVYFTDSTTASPPQTFIGRTVNGASQVLYTFAPTGVSRNFLGLAADHLIFQVQTATDPSALPHYDLLSVSTSSPGTATTIASYDNNTDVQLVGGDLLVTLGTAGLVSGVSAEDQSATLILDVSGAVLRPYLLGSAFATRGTSPMLVSHVSDPHLLAGGEIDVLDLSHPASNGVALKAASGATYTLPADVFVVGLDPITATVGIGGVGFEHGGDLEVEYDLSTGVITPIALPNTTVNFLLP